MYLQWIREQQTRLGEQVSLRERIETYVRQRNGDNLIKNAKSFISRLNEGGLGQILAANRAALPLTLKELVSLDLTLGDLVSDEGAKVSLTELIESEILREPSDIIALRPTLVDLFGPFSSKERRARLSPAVFIDAFGPNKREAAMTVLRNPPFEVKLENLFDALSLHLSPADFTALRIKFSNVKLAHQAQHVKTFAKHAVAVLSAYPLDMWRTETGLQDDYLLLLFPRTPLVEIYKRLHWTATK
jgi:hypothetical protein